jgi:hypothetical protein
MNQSNNNRNKDEKADSKLAQNNEKTQNKDAVETSKPSTTEAKG